MIILHTTCLAWGGSEGNAVTLVRELTKRNISAALLVDREPHKGLTELKQQGLTIETLNTSSSTSPASYKIALSSALRSLNATLIHSHIWERQEEDFETSKSLSIPHVVTIHRTVKGTWFHRVGITKTPWQYRRFRALMRNYNPIVLNISDQSQRAFGRILPEVRRSRRVYVGVPIQSAIANPMNCGQAPTVIWVGSMVHRKRPLLALKVWQRIINDFPDARLKMVGFGPLAETVSREAARTKGAEVVNAPNSWTDLGRNSQILFHTGVAEGTPIVTLEAMALGLPVVCTASGATDELVSDGESGLLAPEDDEDMLHMRLKQLVASPEIRGRLGSRGHQIASQTFAIDHHVDNVLKAYRELAGVAIPEK